MCVYFYCPIANLVRAAMRWKSTSSSPRGLEIPGLPSANQYSTLIIYFSSFYIHIYIYFFLKKKKENKKKIVFVFSLLLLLSLSFFSEAATNKQTQDEEKVLNTRLCAMCIYIHRWAKKRLYNKTTICTFI